VVAQAYHDDAVMTICRRKGAHAEGGQGLVLAPRTGSPPRGIRQAPAAETMFRKAGRPIVWGRKSLRCWAPAYLGLVAQSVGAIDPDVLCKTFALLVEFHVFCELLTVLSVCDERSVDIFCTILTLAEFEIMVDSPSPAYQSASVRPCRSV
jgi:hypothetical protein